MKTLSYLTIAFLGTVILPILANGKAHADEQRGEVKQPRVLHADKNLRMGGVPFFAPTFKIEGSEVAFSGGDYRNTILDLAPVARSSAGDGSRAIPLGRRGVEAENGMGVETRKRSETMPSEVE